MKHAGQKDEMPAFRKSHASQIRNVAIHNLARNRLVLKPAATSIGMCRNFHRFVVQRRSRCAIVGRLDRGDAFNSLLSPPRFRQLDLILAKKIKLFLGGQPYDS
jgi:hypothetical protein